MPTIRVDSEVYSALQSQAIPFIDSPNSVLRRVLQLRPASGSSVEDEASAGQATAGKETHIRSSARTRRQKHARRERAAPGTLLPTERYKRPILEVLVGRGGSAPARDVIEVVGEKLRDVLTAVDKEPIASGGIRWHNRVQFARLHLVEEGAIAKDAPRGVWTITDAGRRAVQ